MSPEELEFWKQQVTSLIRKLLFAFGGYLIHKGWFTQEQADLITTEKLAYYLTGVLFLIVPILWQYAKIRFNFKLVKEAIKAPDGTTLSEVKQKVYKKNSAVISA